jgi:hypothetical protein
MYRVLGVCWRGRAQTASTSTLAAAAEMRAQLAFSEAAAIFGRTWGLAHPAALNSTNPQFGEWDNEASYDTTRGF